MFLQISLAFALVTSPWKLPYQFSAIGTNVGEKYLTTWHSISERTDSPWNELKNYKVLLVEGYFGNWVKRIPHLHNNRSAIHFQDQVDWLTELGVDFDFVPVQTESSAEFNAAIIKKEIENADKKVFIISHSKGGADTLVSLITYPELQEKVAGWMPLNAAFQGSPLASQALDYSVTRWLMKEFFENFGGSIDSLQCLRVEDRQEFIKVHSEEIIHLQKKIPLISFSAFIPNKKRHLDTRFEIPRNLLLAEGYQNDGLLPWESSVLPGSDYVVMEGIDHATTIRFSDLTPFDRKRMMKTLFLMMREKTEAKHF
jgi:hypothetical protein